MKRTLLPFTVWAFAAVLSLSSTARAQMGPVQGVTTSATGLPRGGVNVAVCATLTTSGASVTSNVATLTFASNPTTAGFVASATLTVSGFTGGDTYFNGSFTISATSSTTISFPLTHANASAGTNGTVYQTGSSTQACAPLSTLYTDNTGGTTTPNPFASDGMGNYLTWAAPGYYRIQLYGTGVTTFVYPTGVPCVPTSAVASCGVYGSIQNTQVAFGTAINTIGGSGNFNWSEVNKQLSVQGQGTVLRTISNSNALNSVWADEFTGPQANGNLVQYGSIQAKIIDNTNAAGIGQFDFFVDNAGTPADVLTLTKTGATSPNINGIRFVDGTGYATIGAALASCPATGVAIISTIPETFASDPFAAVTCPFDIWLIGGTSTAIWKTNVGLRIGHNGQRIRGSGPNFTEIQANSGTFPSTTAVISVGAASASGVNGSGVFDLAVDCASVTGCSGIVCDGAQELSCTSNTQVSNCMVDCYQISSGAGAGAGQNQMILDHIRATGCSVSAPTSCVPIHITSTAGFRVGIRDATAAPNTPATSTDCIKNDSTNATVILQIIHVEGCTNGFHNTAAGGLFEVDGLIGHSSVTTLVRNDSSSAGYEIRTLILNSATNTLVDAGRSITTTAPYCLVAGTANITINCTDPAVSFQIPSKFYLTPPIGAGAGITEQLLAGYTGPTAAFVTLDNLGVAQLDFKNDGRPGFRGNQSGAFLQYPTSEILTANRFPLYPNGASATTMVAALVTTAAATDNVTIQGMTASGHCSLTPTNAAAIGAATPPGVTTKAANQITVTHAVTANMNYDVMCTSN